MKKGFLNAFSLKMAHFSNLCDQFRHLQHEVGEMEAPPQPNNSNQLTKDRRRYIDDDPSMMNTINPTPSSRTNLRPGRIDTQELLQNMDTHNPNGCSHYGGSLPLMSYAQV